MEQVYNGIDVSRWQGTVNWPAVKAAGMDFAFIRAGYCGYAGGVTEDAQFKNNMAGAIAAGMDVGVYLYSYATTPAAAATAARQTLDLIQGYQLAYPVAFDIEDATNVALSTAQNTAIAKSFLSTIAGAGYCPLLYTYKAFAETELNMSELGEYDFWLAHVTSKTNYTGPYTVWQYSWTGSVKGIAGDVDLNYCYKDYPAYMKENGLNGYEKSGNEENSGGDGNGEDSGGGNGGADPDDIKYVVMKNDTLTHIAKRYGVPLRELIQANPQIKNPDRIYVGQTIIIPRKPK